MMQPTTWTFRRLVRGLRPLARNWRRVAILMWLVLHGRPRRLFHTRAAGAVQLTARLRSGLSCRCRVNEFYAFLEVYVDCAYDLPDTMWSDVRCVIDAGANVGVATLWFAERAPAAQIVSIEPSPRAFALLRRNVAENGLASRVSMRRVALGGSSGAGRLREHGASVATTVENSDAHAAAADVVEVVSLKRLLAESGVDNVDVLKIDCEGAEFDILLRSDAATLAHVGAIIGEYHLAPDRDVDALREHLVAAGYAVAFTPSSASTGLFQAVRPSPVAARR